MNKFLKSVSENLAVYFIVGAIAFGLNISNRLSAVEESKGSISASLFELKKTVDSVRDDVQFIKGSIQ